MVEGEKSVEQAGRSEKYVLSTRDKVIGWIVIAIAGAFVSYVGWHTGTVSANTSLIKNLEAQLAVIKATRFKIQDGKDILIKVTDNKKTISELSRDTEWIIKSLERVEKKVDSIAERQSE